MFSIFSIIKGIALLCPHPVRWALSQMKQPLPSEISQGAANLPTVDCALQTEQRGALHVLTYLHCSWWSWLSAAMSLSWHVWCAGRGNSSKLRQHRVCCQYILSDRRPFYSVALVNYQSSKGLILFCHICCSKGNLSSLGSHTVIPGTCSQNKLFRCHACTPQHGYLLKPWYIFVFPLCNFPRKIR